jgi:protein disulfide-isomerase
MIWLFTFGLTVSSLDAAVTGTSRLHWVTNFNEAAAQAKSENKMILLLFTGSDWCEWCHKLESEVLATNEFADAVGDKFIFVLCDFPMRTPLEPSLTAQNKELQRRFDIKGYPTIVLLDSQQNLIGQVGYRPGGPRAYADYLLKMVENFKSYRDRVSSLDFKAAPSEELRALYANAQMLQRDEDIQRILAVGLKNPDNRFFLLERYRCLANQGEILSPEAASIRQQLLSHDPNNLYKTHYEIAVIEFEASPQDLEEENYTPEISAAPIVAYIERFGENDTENLWRLNMLLSQLFLDKDKMSEALKYAKACHATAPQEIQSDILVFIRNIQDTMSPLTARN